jgi:hypothetical protein
LVSADRWICPDTSVATHHQDVVATSAPEIKVRKDSQIDEHRWAAIVKPLTQKALKQAKAERAQSIEDGIEHMCSAPEQYIAQIIPVGEKISGCEHRVVTRPADETHVWVQVMAICQYDWNCCNRDDMNSSSRAAGNAAGYKLEGPVSSGSMPATSSTTVKSKK